MSTEESRLCIKKCGFFGDPATLNMCSVCYKKHIRQDNAKAEQDLREKIKRDKEMIKARQEEKIKEKKVEIVAEAEGGGDQPSRCFTCRRRLPLAQIFKCRCSNEFCGKHRYAEEHGCPFDYKNLGRQDLAKKNPLIQASKLDKI